MSFIYLISGLSRVHLKVLFRVLFLFDAFSLWSEGEESGEGEGNWDIVHGIARRGLPHLYFHSKIIFLLFFPSPTYVILTIHMLQCNDYLFGKLESET